MVARERLVDQGVDFIDGELGRQEGLNDRNLGVFLVGQFEEEVSGSPHTAHIVTCVTHDVPRPDRREVVEARFFPTHSLPEPLSPHTAARLRFFQDPRNMVRGP